MSETRRVIFGGLLLSRSTLIAAVDGFCFVPALPKWVSGSGSASVEVTEPSRLVAVPPGGPAVPQVDLEHPGGGARRAVGVGEAERGVVGRAAGRGG